MNYKIENRLNQMLEYDKLGNPQSVCRVLEAEFKPIVENYLLLRKDFRVRFKKEEGKNIFFVEFEAEKVKPFGYIPK